MIDHGRVITTETERFADVLAELDPATSVPTCPDWTAAELLWHLTEVHWFWANVLAKQVVDDEAMEALDASKPQRPADTVAMVAMLDTETNALIGELERRPDEQPAWSWFSSDQTVGFTRRMQVHEAVMHRIDAELTAELDVTAVDPEVAEDGVRHAIEVMFSWWGTQPGFTFSAEGGTVGLELSDTGHTLLVQPGRWRGVGQSGTSYDEAGVLLVDEGEPAAGFSVTAEQLDRWLWGRGDEPESEGDEAALDAVRAVVAAGIQ